MNKRQACLINIKIYFSKILLFPSVQDMVSIYLKFVDAPEGWHSCVQFALVLWNPEDPTQYVLRHMYKKF